MKPDEAIEILDRHYVLHHNVTREKLDKAAKLGIEALERERFMRAYTGITELLPSETKEDNE